MPYHVACGFFNVLTLYSQKISYDILDISNRQNCMMGHKKLDLDPPVSRKNNFLLKPLRKRIQNFVVVRCCRAI